MSQFQEYTFNLSEHTGTFGQKSYVIVSVWIPTKGCHLWWAGERSPSPVPSRGGAACLTFSAFIIYKTQFLLKGPLFWEYVLSKQIWTIFLNGNFLILFHLIWALKELRILIDITECLTQENH